VAYLIASANPDRGDFDRCREAVSMECDRDRLRDDRTRCVAVVHVACADHCPFGKDRDEVGTFGVVLDWTSDVIVGAAPRIAVSKGEVHFDCKLAAERGGRARSRDPIASLHFISFTQISPRWFRWPYVS